MKDDKPYQRAPFLKMRKKESQRHDLWQWEKFLNNKQIKGANKVIKKHLTDGEDEPASTIKTSRVDFCLYKHLKPYLYDILERVKATNTDHFGYSIYDVSDYDLIHVNTYSYKNMGRYDWHSDGARDYTKDIKFTIIVNQSVCIYYVIHTDIMFDWVSSPILIFIFICIILNTINCDLYRKNC